MGMKEEQSKFELLKENKELRQEVEEISILKKELQKTRQELARSEERYEQLQQKAEEDTRKLKNQLTQAQKMEALGTLAGGMAHDFNNLLQAISGYVQLLQKKKGQESPDREYLAKINQAMESASELTRRLLAFSRKVEPAVESINPNAIVEDTVKILERTIPKNIKISTELDDAFPQILLDPNQFVQVLMNLVNNSCDALPGGGEITIATDHITLKQECYEFSKHFAPGEYAVFSVEDNGEGMDRETLGHIFEPFYTNKEVGKGTGLGLSTVYGIVEKHGGEVICCSYPGRGTGFYIFIPILKSGSELSAKTSEEQDEVEGGEHILVVDDEEVILEVTKDMLLEKGYEVSTAQSGEQALELYANSERDIDLVILDLGMPGMGGEACLQELKNKSPELKIIVASGYQDHPLSEEAAKNDDVLFMSKPYRLDRMLHVMRQLLQGSVDNTLR